MSSSVNSSNTIALHSKASQSVGNASENQVKNKKIKCALSVIAAIGLTFAITALNVGFLPILAAVVLTGIVAYRCHKYIEDNSPR